MNLISMDTFWLSETPFVPGSRYQEQSECPRVCTEVVLEDIREKKAKGERLLPDIPIIMAGDFNAVPESWEIKEIEKASEYINLTKGIGVTFHGFLPQEAEETIDYIYLRNSDKKATEKLVCKSVEKWEDREGAVWLSDHYPVCVILEWV